MVNVVNERVLTRVCRNHEIGVTCYVAGVALSEKYSRFTVPFACIRGNVVERRPYTAAPALPRNGEIFRELSWDSRQNGN